jgi:hypothetical protein
MADTRAAAREYIALGLRPIPLWSPSRDPERDDPRDLGKQPRDKHWADRRPFSEFEFHPDDNLALALGEMPDGRWLVGLDFDTRLIPRAFPDLPETMMTLTPRGSHFYYEVAPRTPLGNWVKVGGFLDLKYARGALVAGPSIGRNGVRYSTSKVKPARLPEDILQWIYRSRKQAGFKVSGSWDRKGKQA